MFTLDPRLAADGPQLYTPFADHVVIARKNTCNPWLVVIPKIAGISEIFQLEQEQRNRLFEVVAELSKALKMTTEAHKINTDAIGNMVPQLHLHLIARKTSDPLWPNPVWREPVAVDGWWTPDPQSFIDAVEAYLQPQ